MKERGEGKCHKCHKPKNAKNEEHAARTAGGLGVRATCRRFETARSAAADEAVSPGNFPHLVVRVLDRAALRANPKAATSRAHSKVIRTKFAYC